MVLVQPVVLLLMLLDYTGLTMGLGHYLGSVALELGILRPSSRAQESEADHIGLRLMSESCFNPEAAVGLWQRMELGMHEIQA
jgi:predicted Zn-dependent protease